MKSIVNILFLLTILIVLFATNDSIFIASFATVIGAPVRIASESFRLPFSMSTVIVNVVKNNTK